MLQTIYGNWFNLACMPFGMGAMPQVTREPVSPFATSRFIDGVHQSAQGVLRYKLFIPANLAATPMPLVVMLHGCGQSADDFASGTDMNAKALQQGFMVLYPEQPAFGASRGCWNWFDSAHQQRGYGECALIAGMTREIMDDYPVAAGRVFIAGLSAGGAMAVVLANAYPELFSAVGCHSGLPLGCAVDTSGALHAMRHGHVEPLPAQDVPAAGIAIPVIVFHGDSDDTVHLSNGDSVIRHSLANARGRKSHLARRRAASTVQEQGETRGRAFTRVVHSHPNGAVIAEHWIIHGGGHAWSGGNWRGSYADQKGPSASDEMLRFFLALPLNANQVQS